MCFLLVSCPLSQILIFVDYLLHVVNAPESNCYVILFTTSNVCNYTARRTSPK